VDRNIKGQGQEHKDRQIDRKNYERKIEYRKVTKRQTVRRKQIWLETITETA
jgi:hypothetical protein